MPDPRFEELLEKAHRSLDAGDLVEADKLSTQVSSLMPNHPEALMLGASVAANSGRWQRAEHLLARLLQRFPRQVGPMYFLGEVQVLSGRAEKAVATYAQAFHLEFHLPRRPDGPELFRQLLRIASSAPASVLEQRFYELAGAGRALERAGILHRCADACLGAALGLDVASIPREGSAIGWRAVLAVLAFDRGSQPSWNRRLCESVVLPWMRDALGRGRVETGLYLETAIYEAYVMQTESQQIFRECFSAWVDDMRRAGQVHAAPPASAPVSVAGPRQPRIAFFVQIFSDLAHCRLLVDMLASHSALAEPAFEPVVFCFKCQSGVNLAKLRAAQIQLVPLADPGMDTTFMAPGLLAELGSRIRSGKISALVWVSNPLMMAFAFGMRVAPVQIWWAMKYHGLSFPEIDGYLTGGGAGGGFKRIDGVDWRVGPVAASDWFDPKLAAEASSVKAGLPPHSIAFGTFGREEKLNSAAFLAAVTEILRQVPASVLLWTGRERLAAIQRHFEEAGLAERCIYIGWVNTKLYAQVIDVFLDSFPFPCGYTLYEAMAAGKPVVLRASAESDNTGLHALLGPLLAGAEGDEDDIRSARAIFTAEASQSLYLRAADDREYVAAAVRLATDAAFRAAAGTAYREFLMRFMSDGARVARIYAAHLLAILHQATDRSGKD